MYSLSLRRDRKAMLDKYFETEKRIMKRFYFERQRKAKKYKTSFLKLEGMDESSKAKAMVLEAYYQWIVVQRNLTNSIYWCATIKKAKDSPKDNPVYGLLTETEHKNLT